MTVITLLLGYFIMMNLIGFAMMGIDKYRAKKRSFRIPEAAFFTVAAIGGSIGSIIGMYTFRHKTRHWYFVYGMPFILLLQIVLFIFLLNAPFELSIL